MLWTAKDAFAPVVRWISRGVGFLCRSIIDGYGEKSFRGHLDRRQDDDEQIGVVWKGELDGYIMSERSCTFWERINEAKIVGKLYVYVMPRCTN